MNDVRMAPQFAALSEATGLSIWDPIEDAENRLYTDTPLEPQAVSTEGFVFPIDSAVEITVQQIRVPLNTPVYIRDTDGNTEKRPEGIGSTKSVPPGEYSLELNLKMKAYIRVDNTPVSVSEHEDAVDVMFGSTTRVRIGARSLHRRPGRTLTITDDPHDLLDAVSLFGNAMKTWDPERTFTTLRGHPPLVELDDTRTLPDDATPPANGVRLRVPASHEWIYPIVPLAYFLGATVEPGDPALYLDGWRYPIGVEEGYEATSDRRAFEQHVQDLLQYTFAFEGALRDFYPFTYDIEQRFADAGVVESPAELATQPVAVRTRSFLEETPLSALEATVGRPDWHLTADVEPTPDHTSIMPFLARDLAVVRCPNREVIQQAKGSTPSVLRDVSATAPPEGVPGGDEQRTSARRVGQPVVDPSYFPSVSSMAHAWVGEGVAVGAANPSTSSYHERLTKQLENGDGSLSVQVVVNEASMGAEGMVSEIYGRRADLDFEVTVHRELSMSELEAVFEAASDFVHYIGHVEPEGFQCHDGYLDAAALETVGTNTFLLNACNSYQQGLWLVEKGAIAGVVTLEDVINSRAAKVGHRVAELLNYGFSVESATSVIQDTMFSGGNYVAVGDTKATLITDDRGPEMVHVDAVDGELFTVRETVFASRLYGTGSMFNADYKSLDQAWLVPNHQRELTVPREDMEERLEQGEFVVIADGRFYWSHEVDVESLAEGVQAGDVQNVPPAE